jgi:hypothetical protein
MNCQEFWNTMPELEELDQSAGQRRDQHLGDCPACAIRMVRQRELTAGFRALSGDLRHLETPSRVADRLRAAFRSQSGLQAERPVRRWWIPALTWASAAAAVIALALFLVRDRPPEATRPPAPHGMELAMLELAMLELPGELDASETDTSDTSNGFVPPGFIRLPNAAKISPNEDVNLVCVEVPRSSMIALGFEVSAERAAEPVRADVMLGADGMARAVRFLDE